MKIASRMEHLSDRQFLKALTKLKEQESIIERSIEYFLENMKIDPEILQDSIQECKSLSLERLDIENILLTKVYDINADFETIRSVVNQSSNDMNIDIDVCQENMKILLEKIEQFNVESELEVLKKKEKNLDDILTEFRINLSDSKEKNISLNKLNVSKSRSRINTIDDDTEDYHAIHDFHSLVIKTGHTQHWKEKDHLLFLNTRKKCLNIPNLVKEIQKQCPDLTAEKIINHEVWYKIYLTLREQQRKSINEWRERKDKEKRRKIEAGESNKINKIKISEKNDKQGKAEKNIPCSEDSEHAIEKKKLIKQWRGEKENARIADLEISKYQKEVMQARKQRQSLLHTTKIRNAVNIYKQQKGEKKSSVGSTGNNKIIKKSEGSHKDCR